MVDFLKTIATIGGVMFFCLFFVALGALVYSTLNEMWKQRDLFEDNHYDWKDME
jgi:hypothetical protein